MSAPARPAAASPARRAPVPADVQRARVALLGLEVVTGVAVATWLSRIPSIKEMLDLSAGELGRLILVGSVGSLAMVVAAGALTARWGSRRALWIAALMFSVSNVFVGAGPHMGSVVVLTVAMFVSSSSYALANVPLNVETVVIERAIGRSVVPQFHAAFSIGTVVGSLLGAAVSRAGVPVGWHFVGMAAVTLALRAWLVPLAVLPAAPDAGPAGVPRTPRPAVGGGLRASLGAWREGRTLLIALVVMTGVLSEGVANNWLTVAVVEGFQETEAAAALVYGVFTAAMTVARFVGTWVIDRYGRVRVLAASSLAELAGLLAFGLGPSLTTAVLGAVVWGLGTGLVFPIGVAAVSGDRARMAGRVSVVSTFGSTASTLAPPLLGAAADGMGVRHALLLVTGGFVLAVVLARVVADPPAEPDGAPSAAAPAAPADAAAPAGSVAPPGVQGPVPAPGAAVPPAQGAPTAGTSRLPEEVAR